MLFLNNVNLNLFRSFYYVAKYGGFTKASKVAMISQSALSSNIKNLEEILNKKLFNRNVSEVTLTNEGKELFLKVEEAYNILNGNDDQKEINIGCVRIIADNYLDSSIVTFRKKYPKVNIRIEFDDITELYQSLRKDEIDIIISRYPLFFKFENYIKVEKIKNIDNVFVCSSSFYKKEFSKMKKDNYVYPLILPTSSGKKRNIEKYLVDNNIFYETIIEMPSSNLLKKLILNDVGIGYINKKFVEDEINEGKMIILENFKDLPVDNITIIYNSNKNSKVLKSFIDILKEAIKKINN